MELSSHITEVHNIGESRAKKFHNLGIYTVKDLIEHFPRDYDDRSDVKKINALCADEVNTFRGKILSVSGNIRIRSKLLTKVKIGDGTGKITAVWYNQAYLKNTFKEGEEYLFTGKFTNKFGRSEILSPEFEKIKEGELLSGGRIIPVYPATSGLSQKVLRSFIKDTLDKTKNQLYDFLPMWIRKKYNLSDRNFAIQNIHFPEDNNSFFIARRRLVFEELFMLQVSLLRIKLSASKDKEGHKIYDRQYSDMLKERFTFKLTGAQEKVFSEILEDIQSGRVMNRLIQGDVGSGKTAVAMLGAFTVIKNGVQAALMVPTEVLAVQHYESFKKLFGGFGLKTVLLSGSLKKKEKEEILREIRSGEAHMVIGTHAVIQKTVTFKNLGLVITDEQHRFGVRQRGVLAEKGDNPHVLVMTATPIPRTLALILYGDLDISVIDELPPGREKIDTFAVKPSFRERVYGFVKKEVDKGRQAYIICPMIDESDKIDAEAVITYTARLKEGEFKDYKVESLHGKMKPAGKQESMDKFLKGETDILVSTTVIEVGINMPNATVMLIENAERFGLAQLHQLRGRVGRGREKSYCILIFDSDDDVTTRRMKVMQKSNDGFEISEMDLELRGPGEFFGTRQHGLPEMKIANLYKDMLVLKEAQEAAKELVMIDSGLNLEEHSLFKAEQEGMYNLEKLNL